MSWLNTGEITVTEAGAAGVSARDAEIKHDLGNAITVAKIDRHQAPMVPAAVHPAHQDNGLADISARKSPQLCDLFQPPKNSAT